MKFRVAALLFALLFFTSAARATEESKPGWWTRTLRFFHLARHSENNDGNRATVRLKELALTMQLSPLPLKLSDTRQLKVTLLLANRSSGRFVHLQFPTTQRFEILIHDTERNKLVTQWSEDQSFSNEPAYVTINPGERVEYNAVISTRDLVAGRAYTVEAFFPNFDKLRIQQAIVPEK
jgi:hypothetical protein